MKNENEKGFKKKGKARSTCERRRLPFLTGNNNNVFLQIAMLFWLGGLDESCYGLEEGKNPNQLMDRTTTT